MVLNDIDLIGLVFEIKHCLNPCFVIIVNVCLRLSPLWVLIYGEFLYKTYSL